MSTVRITETQRSVLRMFAHDREPDFIAEALQIPQADVEAAITELAGDDMNRAAELVAEYDRRAQLVNAAKPAEHRQLPTPVSPAAKPAPAPAPPKPAPPRPPVLAAAQPPPLPTVVTRSLLERAARSGYHRTRGLGEKIHGLLAELAAKLEEEERAEREAAERQAALRAAQLRVDELEKQLASARDDLAGDGGRAGAGRREGRTDQPDRDYDPRVVRAWAAKKGVECPRFGRVPDAVIAAWRGDADREAS